MFIIFNYGKLERRISERYNNQDAFVKEMDMTKQEINLKLMSAVDFTKSEIERASELLDIKPERIPEYFFDIEYNGFEN